MDDTAALIKPVLLISLLHSCHCHTFLPYQRPAPAQNVRDVSRAPILECKPGLYNNELQIKHRTDFIIKPEFTIQVIDPTRTV